jgi:hypothetical protein
LKSITPIEPLKLVTQTLSSDTPGGHENDRQVDLVGCQFLLQLHTGFARHLYIEDQTTGHIRAWVIEELSRRPERSHLES